jgi:DNA-binding winged helix-turn-helix (wHTH) protein
MVRSNPSQNCARFHEFQVDLSTGVLERSGVRVSVQAQPLQVLRLLLQAEGKVVTREEVRKVLWPEDTFVDFELGVNTAVKKLRQALADPADDPKFIETLPKVGYRFLVPVEWVTEDGQKGSTPKVQDSAPSSGIGVAFVSENRGEAAHVVDLERRTAVTKKRIWLAVGVAAFILLSLALLLRVLRGSADQSLAAIEVLPLVSMPGSQRGPAVSPDGSYVAFSSDDAK